MASPTNETLVLLGPRVRAQAQRFRLSDRKRRVIEAILSLTFDCGIDTASIPRLRDLATLTRLDKSDLSKTVRALQLDGILQVIRNAGVSRYCILPDSAFWQVGKLKEAQGAADSAFQDIRAWKPADQMELPWDKEPDLKESVARVSIEAAVGKLPTAVGDSPTATVGDSPTPTALLLAKTSSVGESPTLGGAPLKVKRYFKALKPLKKEAVSERERDAIRRMNVLFTKEETSAYGANNRLRYRECPSKFERVMDDLEEWQRSGNPTRSYAALFDVRWREFQPQTRR